MPQFSKQSTRPLLPRSYRATAARLREIADMLERYAEATDPRDRGARTQAVRSLSGLSRSLADRHFAALRRHAQES